MSVNAHSRFIVIPDDDLDETPISGAEPDPRVALTAAFLRPVLPNQGVIIVATYPHVSKQTGKLVFWHYPCSTIEEAAEKIILLNDYYINSIISVFFAIHSFKDNSLELGSDNSFKSIRRTAENAERGRSFSYDLDVQKEGEQNDKKYGSQIEALEDLKRVYKELRLPEPMIVNSGRGVHAHWCFAEPEGMSSDEWKVLAEKFERILDHHGLKFDHAVSADRARVLRPVGTENRKNPSKPLPVALWSSGASPAGVAEWKAIIDREQAKLPLVEPRKSARRTGLTYPDTQENRATLRTILAAVRGDSRDVNREDWMVAVGGAAAAGPWGIDEAREWSQSGATWDEGEFDKLTNWYDPDKEGGIKFGSLFRLAKIRGYHGPGLRQGEGDTLVAAGPISTGDIANGQRFADEFRGKLLWIFDVGEWLRFDAESGWVSEPSVEVEAAAKAVIKSMGREAAEAVIAAPHDPAAKRRLKEFERTSRLPHMRAMIEMAKSEPGMAASLVEFDADPMLLGVLNGVLDLRTGTLRSVSPELRVSKRCRVAFDSGVDCPRFRAFLKEVLPEADVRAFLRRFVGYTITGSVEEQVFAFLHGSGANGKSVLVELLAWLLGDYARKISTDMLMQQQRSAQGPDPDIVELKGVRFAYANETEDGRRLSDARVKDMTGGDTLTGRVPYAKAAVRFDPTFQLVIVGNHKPAISDTSNGMWRRVILIPFEQTIAEADRDPNLLAKLKAEGSGILNWALAGLSEWRKERLRVPTSIKAATAAYRDEQDVLKEFIFEICDIDGTSKVAKDTLNWTYQNWCKDNGHKPMSATRLTRDLGDRGFKRDPGRRHILGLILKPPTSPAFS